MSRIDIDLNITGDTDPTVKANWYPVCINVFYKYAYDAAQTFVSVQGRGAYLYPIYQALVDSGQRDIAIEWNNQNIGFYSNIAERGVMNILNGDIPSAGRRNQRRVLFWFIN